MRAGERMKVVHAQVCSVAGLMSLKIAKRRGPRPDEIRSWVEDLRQAADCLERLVDE